jgi:hypothetical protein
MLKTKIRGMVESIAQSKLVSHATNVQVVFVRQIDAAGLCLCDDERNLKDVSHALSPMAGRWETTESAPPLSPLATSH